MARRAALYLPAFLIVFISLWVSKNAMLQTLAAHPGETIKQAIIWLLVSRPLPGSIPCSDEIHNRYTTQGPDGMLYPTWHPSIDPITGCYFNHEHGSDPHSFIGFAQSGMPALGYTAAQTGLQESHVGYKVAVSNDDLNGHAWMIIYNQDTSKPQRLYEQYHTVDWVISNKAGRTLVNIHSVADYGYAYPNCHPDMRIIGTAKQDTSVPTKQYRFFPTIQCEKKNPYETWIGTINVGDVFKATPSFDVENPITFINIQDPEQRILTCSLYSPSLSCLQGDPQEWLGTFRSILHPGQIVDNPGPEIFLTDGYGKLVDQGTPGALPQFVTNHGWDTRNCCGNEVVFRIQTFSEGIFIANPLEPSTEFSVGKR